VVAGTAGAVHHHQEQKYANQAAQQQAAGQDQQQAAYEQGIADAQAQQQAAPPPAPAPQAAPAGTDLTAQLTQLSQLHNAGVLSDEEFAAAKQKLLSGG
jgi:hypothetical protein